MELKALEKVLSDYLSDKNLKLFSLNYNKKEKTLTILLDEKMDMDQIEVISNELSNLMDNYDEDFDDYVLDVSTVGIEKPIRNSEELKEAIGSYIYLQTNNDKLYGDLIDYKEGNLSLKVKDKTKEKVITVLYKNIKKMRYAVKF